MINIYKKIPPQTIPQFSMPRGLYIIKECASAGIDWKDLHIADLLSIIYSIRIDNAIKYLEHQRLDRMHARGINSITQATEQDFDNL